MDGNGSVHHFLWSKRNGSNFKTMEESRNQLQQQHFKPMPCNQPKITHQQNLKMEFHVSDLGEGESDRWVDVDGND